MRGGLGEERTREIERRRAPVSARERERGKVKETECACPLEDKLWGGYGYLAP